MFGLNSGNSANCRSKLTSSSTRSIASLSEGSFPSLLLLEDSLLVFLLRAFPNCAGVGAKTNFVSLSPVVVVALGLSSFELSFGGEMGGGSTLTVGMITGVGGVVIDRFPLLKFITVV